MRIKLKVRSWFKLFILFFINYSFLSIFNGEKVEEESFFVWVSILNGIEFDEYVIRTGRREKGKVWIKVRRWENEEFVLGNCECLVWFEVRIFWRVFWGNRVEMGRDIWREKDSWRGNEVGVDFEFYVGRYFVCFIYSFIFGSKYYSK